MRYIVFIGALLLSLIGVSGVAAQDASKANTSGPIASFQEAMDKMNSDLRAALNDEANVVEGWSEVPAVSGALQAFVSVPDAAGPQILKVIDNGDVYYYMPWEHWLFLKGRVYLPGGSYRQQYVSEETAPTGKQWASINFVANQAGRKEISAYPGTEAIVFVARTVVSQIGNSICFTTLEETEFFDSEDVGDDRVKQFQDFVTSWAKENTSLLPTHCTTFSMESDSRASYQGFSPEGHLLPKEDYQGVYSEIENISDEQFMNEISALNSQIATRDEGQDNIWLSRFHTFFVVLGMGGFLGSFFVVGSRIWFSIAISVGITSIGLGLVAAALKTSEVNNGLLIGGVIVALLGLGRGWLTYRLIQEQRSGVSSAT